MSTSVRSVATFLILSLIVALSACGSSGIHVCNAVPGCCGPSDACPAPQYLYATNTSGQVTSFPIDLGTGGLGTPTSVSGPVNTLSLASFANTYLYASDFQHSTIYAWSIKFSDGSLTPVQGSPFALPPLSVAAGLATNITAQVVYVADAGKIDALQINSIGSLSPLPNSPFASGSNIFLTLDPNQQFLFASDDDPPGGVLAFTVNSSGDLNQVPGSPFPAIPNFNGNTEPLQIVVDFTGNFVFTTLYNTNQVAAFTIVKPQGTLNPVPGSPFSAGSGPLSLATTRNFLYVSNGTDGTISGYMIDPTTGMLSPLADSPFQIHAANLAAGSVGTYLYATGAGGIQVFSINSQTGALTPIQGSPFPDLGVAALTYLP